MQAVLNGQERFTCRRSGPDPFVRLHTFGLLEIDSIVGVPGMEVWSSPEQRVWTSEYLDALLTARS